MILIIFIVNTSEFVCFFFKSGDSHEGRQRMLVVERLPYNHLNVSSVTFMSVTV